MVELDRFTVSSRREGTAKAIMEQRNSMNVKNVIASDTFGDMMENNIARGAAVPARHGDLLLRRRSEHAQDAWHAGAIRCAYDGWRADRGHDQRQPQPEINAYSANAADTLEYTKTNSADMDADAPAGTVNMKSKSAFQRKGRFFAFQLYGLVNSYELSIGKSNGPNDGQTQKTLPGISLDFSDVYLDGKLGVVLNLSETNSSNEQGFVTYTYNTAPTAASPEPMMLTTINYTNGPKVNRRRSGGLNLEYKLVPNVIVALRSSFNHEDARIYNRQVQLIATRASLAPGSNAHHDDRTSHHEQHDAGRNRRCHDDALAHESHDRAVHHLYRKESDCRHELCVSAAGPVRPRTADIDGTSGSMMASDYQFFNIGVECAPKRDRMTPNSISVRPPGQTSTYCKIGYRRAWRTTSHALPLSR